MANKKGRGVSAARLIGDGIAGAARLLTLPLGRAYGARTAAQASMSLAPIVRVQTSRGTVLYRCPSATAARQATRMTAREPDTIDWLNEHVKAGEHMWDVGANIGVFSIYAALCKGVSVTAFEPVASNFAILTDAVILNGMGGAIVSLAMGLSDTTGLLTIYLIDMEAGAGLHALGAPENVRGAFEPAAVVTVPVIRGADAMALFGVRQPDHIKIDVDGHEMGVLAGLGDVLRKTRTVWIETTEEAEAAGGNAQVSKLLEGAGFARAELASGRRGENTLFVNRTI